MREAVGKLPPRQREAVWLFYFQDFAQHEIATIMQIQRGAVGALLFQARSRLAGLLGWPDGEGQNPMNIDEALRALGETLSEPAVDVEAGRQRLRAAVRRLHDDPLEARRIDNLAKLVDRYEKDYRRGHEALRRQDFDTAEHYLPPGRPAR